MPPGVLCLEGMWTNKLTDRSTVRPVLDMLETSNHIRYVYRDIGTPEELRHYLRLWTQKQYSRYRLGYLAFHGDPGCIWVGSTRVGFDDLGDWLAGRAAGRVLYFGSCSTMKVTDDELRILRERTGARAVVGYGRYIEWLESLAFEVLLIEALSRYKHIDAPFRYLEKNYRPLMERLDLRWQW